ncbi:zinc-dependent alcohol dehydrogenase [Pseudonocardia xinjiangensis]|uniref:zinc-dependent alcohol dehydrogenase n=1 Tax=Pseudonocardia xinjiangensis TaxID=75289 RepID=UPI003D8B2AD7
MGTMRQVVVHSTEDIRLEEVPRPGPPGPGEVRVASALVGICGSDTHAAAGHHPFIDRPYRPGHEVVGVVEEVGAGVSDLAAGDRVVLEPSLVCGKCRRCREGRYNICEKLAVVGCQTAGGMADAFTVPRDRLHRVPEGMSDELAALVEPLATPVHAVRLAGVGPGSRVAVLGAGPIGLLVLVAARRAGAEVVLVTDVMGEKLDRARRLGADEVLLANAPDLVERAAVVLDGADVVFDCVARESSMAQAVELVAKGGTVVVVGVAAGPTVVPLHVVQDREIRVLGSLMYVREDVEQAIEVLASGAVTAGELVTAIFPVEQAAEAFGAASDPQQVKVLVSLERGSPVATTT